MYFIDTNICIYFLNEKFPSVREKFLSISPNEIKISAIVKAELLLGAFKSRTREQTTNKIEKFLSPFAIVDFTNEMTYEYAKIRKDLEQAGIKIGANDLFIVATALHENATLITHNMKEFSRVKNLKLEDWVKD
ncbi:MAG: type II toxin-antitoxin system tRNA(fMet)-specific endonuclease VapC [Treponema sp.]